MYVDIVISNVFNLNKKKSFFSLTIGGTVLKESDDLVILGGTIDSKITFEKHLR